MVFPLILIEYSSFIFGQILVNGNIQNTLITCLVKFSKISKELFNVENRS